MARTPAPRTTAELHESAMLHLETALGKLETAAQAIRKAIRAIKTAKAVEAAKDAPKPA